MSGLLKAIKANDIEKIKYILLEDKSVDPAANNNEALRNAILNGKDEVVKLLLADPRVDPTNAPIRGAVRSGHAKVVKLLLADPRVDPTANNNEAIRNAMLNGKDEVVKLLLADPRVDPTANDNNAIKWAVMRNKTEFVKLLLSDPRVDPTADNNKAIRSAAERGHTEIVKLLLADPRVDPTANNNEAIRNAIQDGKAEVVKLLLTDPRVGPSTVPILERFIVSYYKSFIEKIHQMIFIEQSKNKIKELYKVTNNDNKEVHKIYNNYQYISNEQSTGERLFLDETRSTPIGYNIHIPSGKVDAIIVNVYGGRLKSEREEVVYTPDDLLMFDQYLLNSGVAVVKLNLPDLLELEVFQFSMSESLHFKIQQCIDKFYQTLTKNPESLHYELKDFDAKNLPIYLYGASFGGLICIKHAEMYPKTFTGYISHNGGINAEMLEKSDLLSRGAPKSYLDPSQKGELNKLTDFLLITQTRDDNNVNAKAATDFYKKMLKLDKSNLIRLWITESGNPATTKKPWNKGHGIPSNKNDFITYCESILSFMKNGPSALPEISELENYRLDKLANKYYSSGTLIQKYIAEVFETFEKQLQTYKNLEPEKVKNIDMKKYINSGWDSEYKPLYYAMTYAKMLSEDKEKLQEEVIRINTLLTDKKIINSMKSQENIFAQYVEEIYPAFKLPEEIKLSDLIVSKEMIQNFKDNLKALTQKDPATVNYFLSTLYKANPSILQPLYESFERNAALQNDLTKAREKLGKAMNKGQTKLLSLYRAHHKRTELKQEIQHAEHTLKSEKSTLKNL